MINPLNYWQKPSSFMAFGDYPGAVVDVAEVIDETIEYLGIELTREQAAKLREFYGTGKNKYGLFDRGGLHAELASRDITYGGDKFDD